LFIDVLNNSVNRSRGVFLNSVFDVLVLWRQRGNESLEARVCLDAHTTGARFASWTAMSQVGATRGWCIRTASISSTSNRTARLSSRTSAAIWTNCVIFRFFSQFKFEQSRRLCLIKGQHHDDDQQRWKDGDLHTDLVSITSCFAIKLSISRFR